MLWSGRVSFGAAKANSEAGCASGAIGGVVGHLTAEAVKDLKLKDSEVLALGQITSVLAATLAQKDLNIANSSAQNAILNNRQLHEDEAKRLEALKLGKTKAQQDRLDAAACALVRCADGVPDSDANKQKLLALQTEGEKYTAEKQILKNTGLFVYKTTDMYGDILTKNKEIAKRLGGGLNAISGAAGAVGGGALVGAGVAACPVSFGLTCVGGVTLGGFIMVDEYGRSKDGVQNLLGAFVSDEGKRVLDSLNPSTYPGERDPLKEAGIDAAKNVGAALFGKYLLKTFAKLDGLDTKVASKTSSIAPAVLPDNVQKSILDTPLGSRPPPENYLPDSYIANHLKDFEESGVVRFASKDSIGKYGTLGPDGGYVFPRNQFDQIMKNTGGDLRQVEVRLGLPPNYLNSSDTIAVYVKPENIQGLRMPSGNEPGTNPYWKPGGYTSGGVKEAVVNFSYKPPYSILNFRK